MLTRNRWYQWTNAILQPAWSHDPKMCKSITNFLIENVLRLTANNVGSKKIRKLGFIKKVTNNLTGNQLYFLLFNWPFVSDILSEACGAELSRSTLLSSSFLSLLEMWPAPSCFAWSRWDWRSSSWLKSWLVPAAEFCELSFWKNYMVLTVSSNTTIVNLQNLTWQYVQLFIFELVHQELIKKCSRIFS